MEQIPSDSSIIIFCNLVYYQKSDFFGIQVISLYWFVNKFVGLEWFNLTSLKPCLKYILPKSCVSYI